MSRVLRSLRTTYLTVDPRSLGLFRIALGFVLLADLWRRYEQLDFWYTNSGLLPNHTLLWRPPAGHMFSLFFVASTRGEAELGFALCAAIYLLFVLGYRTQLVQVAALICRVSVNSRLAVLENGGDMVLNLLCIFSLVLPLGRRFSIDAWLRSVRDGRIADVESLNSEGPPAIETRPVISLAMLGLILQFATIYFFNAISKQGDAWLKGDAVHYALHLDKYVTGFGVWMREHVPAEWLRRLTWSVLGVEWLGFALIISPIGSRYTRTLAVLMLPGLHLGFALGLNLGGFSPAMMSFYALLLTREHWEWLGRALERRCASRIVALDTSDPRALQRARVIRELDRFGAITWLPAPAPGAQPASASVILPALPFGFALAWPLRVPGLRAPWLLLGRAALRAGAAALSERPAPPPRAAAPALRWIAHGCIALLVAAIGSEVVNDNTSVPQALRFTQPRWAKAIIEYPRLLQGWRMFAPDPPRVDTMLHVDAVTADGKHVDPFNSVASRQQFPDGDVVPKNMDQSQWFTMYSDRIADPNYAAYRQAFMEWLLAYPQRTGRASDCLTSFDVYLVSDESPAPGSGAAPKPLRRERFMQYSAPADSSCAALQLSAAVQALQAAKR
ncbi:MAG TPA: hypothetical protein VJR89_40225 [Polyangiales bacterium]|nr:hypothetical protein [Polyangiales bacterium]